MKNFTITLLFILGCTSISYGQDSKSTEQQPLTFAEQMPEFPGGKDALLAFLQKNIKYPVKALEEEIDGKVIVNIIINIDGTISNAKVTKAIGGGCDEEALRVINNMPNWIPGKQGGELVPVYFDVPVTFKID
jgi:protein TonB